MAHQVDATSIPKMIYELLKKYKYHLPKIGGILKERDMLRADKDSLLNILRNLDKNYPAPQVDFQKIAKKYQPQISGVEKFLKGKKNIFDVGTGPHGSSWWKHTDRNSHITGIDWYFFASNLPKNVSISKYDAAKLNQITQVHPEYQNKFDLVVARHILEHVTSPLDMIKGISQITKKGAIVYTGFPDYRNFTDIFYHLVHPEGGGHIALITNTEIQSYFEQNGFKLVECNIWPEDWLWLQQQFDFRGRGLAYTTQSEINYICDVFRRELTVKKGYFYGWEMVFQKL